MRGGSGEYYGIGEREGSGTNDNSGVRDDSGDNCSSIGKDEPEENGCCGGIDNPSGEGWSAIVNGSRIPKPVRALNSGGRIKTKTNGKEGFTVDRETVILRGLEQITDSGQTQALCRALIFAARHSIDGKHTLKECVDDIMERMDAGGPDILCDNSYVFTGLTLPRAQEIFGCFNRCRFLTF